MSTRTRTLVFHTLFSATLLGLCSTPSLAQVHLEGSMVDGKIVISPEQRKQAMAMLKGAMGSRPKPGRTVAEALQASKQYETFLKIAARGGMMPLLGGTAADTTRPKITFASLKDQMQISSSDIQISGEGMEGVNITELKSSLMDLIEELAGEDSEFMIEILAEEKKITVFAPTDQALAKLPKPRLDTLLRDSVAAAAFIRGHVVTRGIYRDAFTMILTMTSMRGTSLVVDPKASSLTINQAKVTESDIDGDNGVVHGVDGVLSAGLPLKSTPSTKTTKVSQ